MYRIGQDLRIVKRIESKSVSFQEQAIQYIRDNFSDILPPQTNISMIKLNELDLSSRESKQIYRSGGAYIEYLLKQNERTKLVENYGVNINIVDELLVVMDVIQSQNEEFGSHGYEYRTNDYFIGLGLDISDHVILNDARFLFCLLHECGHAHMFHNLLKSGRADLFTMYYEVGMSIGKTLIDTSQAYDLLIKDGIDIYYQSVPDELNGDIFAYKHFPSIWRYICNY